MKTKLETKSEIVARITDVYFKILLSTATGFLGVCPEY
ncbi:hypothetical protein NSP_16930 [Nodularia spumigena CCY9414]|nr:hypothetical protein NSP_16930 [Nodularia spumigena CCY9414]